MDSQRKLDLLKRSYLHGYAALFAGMDGAMNFLEMGASLSSNEGGVVLEDLVGYFTEIEDHYKNKIPFGEIVHEISSEDWDDFAPLFKVREVLPTVGLAVRSYADFVRKNGYSVSKSSEVSQNFWKATREWDAADYHKGKRLKEIIVLYDPCFVSDFSDGRSKS